MKKVLLLSLTLGVLLGILQAHFVQKDTRTVQMPTYSDCGPAGFCLPEVTGYRDEQVTYNERQGFPISKLGTHEFNLTQTDTLHYQAPLIVNFLIFAVGLPLVSYIAYRLTHNKSG